MQHKAWGHGVQYFSQTWGGGFICMQSKGLKNCFLKLILARY